MIAKLLQQTPPRLRYSSALLMISKD